MRTKLASLASRRIPLRYAVPLVIIAPLAAFFLLPSAGSATAPTATLVGVWKAAADAPYIPHMIRVDSDGTFQIANPTGVQLKADGSGVTDASGLGLWQSLGDGRYSIEFWELNANQTPDPATGRYTPADTLQVRATLRVTGDTFVSLAGDVAFDHAGDGQFTVVATYTPAARPRLLTGTRQHLTLPGAPTG